MLGVEEDEIHITIGITVSVNDVEYKVKMEEN